MAIKTSDEIQAQKKRFCALQEKARDNGLASLSAEEKAEYIALLSAPPKGRVAKIADNPGA